jgi:aminopeptidase YwaD
MPKNFPFYNPEEHKRIYALLEAKRPAALLTATGRNPELVGALYPYPLINDGDFEIPTAYCTEATGEEIIQGGADRFTLKINAERIPATASNVIASKNPGVEKKVVVTAHIDAYEESPGATDNATGTVVLLLLAELLSEYRGPLEIEIAAFNGEDHYSAAGELDYLKRYGSDLERIQAVINIDDIGFREGRSAYSFYECPLEIEQAGREIFAGCPGITEGEPWYNGDHMVFVQKGIPAVAFAAEYMPELMREYTHTSRDTPDIVDCKKIVEVARALEQFIRNV